MGRGLPLADLCCRRNQGVIGHWALGMAALSNRLGPIWGLDTSLQEVANHFKPSLQPMGFPLLKRSFQPAQVMGVRRWLLCPGPYPGEGFLPAQFPWLGKPEVHLHSTPMGFPAALELATGQRLGEAAQGWKVLDTWLALPPWGGELTATPGWAAVDPELALANSLGWRH